MTRPYLPAHSFTGHPQHEVATQMIDALIKVKGNVHLVQSCPETLGLIIQLLDEIRHRTKGHVWRLPADYQQSERLNG